jgi:hypothetical protein
MIEAQNNVTVRDQDGNISKPLLVNRLFIYRGYEIKEFDYDYSRKQDNKWCAYNTNDCDEVLQISKTFDEMLDIIDHLFDCRF